MKNKIKELEIDKIAEILADCDHRISFEKTNTIPDETKLLDAFKEYIDYDGINEKSVLGIDIYQYSAYPEFQQTLIPFLFKLIFDLTKAQCQRNHPYIFQKISSADFNNHFISTGDGGFLLFDTPLHSLVFAMNFALVVRVFNAYHLHPRLRKIIGGISFRYAITYDKIYHFDGNFYGRAIINNARILQKDNLNRCLIDQNVHRWFTLNVEGLENMQLITIHDISNIDFFNNNYDRSILVEKKDEMFNERTRDYGVLNSDILKIGTIASKETKLNIYNLHMQVAMRLYDDDHPENHKLFTISLGNLNTAGI
ncbi:MAG: hypothetical protein PHU97_04575 [Bacteroidales bacterium]|nr:hypothetical protein [Bacteroidales bacterium]MDD2322277.1 hypothetical protein [Bacteroidales bacterium]MDD3010573.1 hypothetical protein [Bacteroidales bacterium]MDD3961277.1 hypothetical protein [Bacteroidales bacterium]MDY0286333.1 hypothetical protein [Bacteroidales bacterium]